MKARKKVAPAANAIARETKLPLSHVFSSDEALERVEARAKRERFNVPPKRVGIFRRFLLDRLPRRLLVVAVVAAAVGSWIAVG